MLTRRGVLAAAAGSLLLGPAPIRHGGMERDSLGVYVVIQGTWTPYA